MIDEGRVEEIVQESKRHLQDYYTDRLKGVILYGSMARHEAQEESDIDLLVLLEGPVDFGDELWRIVQVLSPVQDHSNYLISAKPVDYEDFVSRPNHFYQSVREEGVPI